MYVGKSLILHECMMEYVHECSTHTQPKVFVSHVFKDSQVFLYDLIPKHKLVFEIWDPPGT